MDVYLPAEFHLLHDDAASDWRDAHHPTPEASAPVPCAHAARDVDPDWCAL